MLLKSTVKFTFCPLTSYLIRRLRGLSRSICCLRIAQTDHCSLVSACCCTSILNQTKQDRIPSRYIRFLLAEPSPRLDSSVTLLLMAGADHNVLSPLQRNKTQKNDCENPSICSPNWLMPWEHRNNKAALCKQYISLTLFSAYWSA